MPASRKASAGPATAFVPVDGSELAVLDHQMGPSPSQSMPGPPQPTIVRAEGCYLFDADGRCILDAGGGAIVTNIGHGRKEVVEVAARALEQVSYVLPTWLTPQRTELLERLIDRWLPEGFTHVSLVSGGSESTDTALRLARHHHVAAGRAGRWKVIGRQVSFHGMTLATLAAGGHAERRAPYTPLMLGFLKSAVNDAGDLEAVIRREGVDSVAAFIGEPVIGASAGGLVAPDDYWPRVREICDRYGVLLIADEVMTGFGRTGRKFALEHWGVTPDILVAGKGLAGGYAPMGGIYCGDHVMAPIVAAGQQMMFYTYSAHPAGCAAANKVLEIIEREDLIAHGAAMGAQLGTQLERLRNHQWVRDIRGLGLMWGIELGPSSDELYPEGFGAARRVCVEALRRGVWVYPCGSGPYRDVIMLGPSFTVNTDEIKMMIEVLEASIDGALGDGQADRKEH